VSGSPGQRAGTATPNKNVTDQAPENAAPKSLPGPGNRPNGSPLPADRNNLPTAIRKTLNHNHNPSGSMNGNHDHNHNHTATGANHNHDHNPNHTPTGASIVHPSPLVNILSHGALFSRCADEARLKNHLATQNKLKFLQQAKKDIREKEKILGLLRENYMNFDVELEGDIE
jgi:hypothetical protein